MKTLSLLAATTALLVSTPAGATLLTFTVSGALPGDYHARFQLDSSPVPLPENVFDGFLFGIADVPGFTTLSGLAGVTFFNASATGGILINDGLDYLLDANGVQLYTGPESAPTFRLGTFALTGLSTPGDFVVRIAAVPEPASWAMLIGGFTVAGGVLRYRRRTLAVRNGA